jgi:hypothetical protein
LTADFATGAFPARAAGVAAAVLAVGAIGVLAAVSAVFFAVMRFLG